MAHLGDIPTQFWGPDEWNEALPYAMLRGNFVAPVTHKDYSKMAMDNIQYLMHRSIADVRRGALAGKADDVLELAARSIVGVTTRLDEDAALTLLHQLVAPANPHKASRSLRARAWALLAHIHDERRIDKDDPDCWNIDSLYRAAMCADEACALGFVPPGVLSVGMTVERSGFRRKEDLKFPGWSTERFEKLSELWRAVDRRKAEIQREDMKRERKVRKDPNAYICAAEGCGIEATHKAALQRCSGKCAAEGKPAYCSKECQKQDWKRHKPFCREGAPVDEVAASKRQLLLDEPDAADTPPKLMNLADTDTYQRRMEFFEGKLWSDGTTDPVNPEASKNERRIHMPSPQGGKDILVSASTMDPAFMKEVKAEAEKVLGRR